MLMQSYATAHPLVKLLPVDWSYPETNATRDLRLDFMRGFVIPLLFASHFDFFSALMYVGWERVGVVSTAEIFVILSGMVVGMVYGKKIKISGFGAALPGIYKRAADLYRINIMIILMVALIRYLPGIDSTIITTFHDTGSGQTYQLYPPLDASIFTVISKALLLQIGPHQFQIVGLYVVLFVLFTPLSLFLLSKGKIWALLAISWILYLINAGADPFYRPTNAQFEYAFPILSWQLIYVHGIAAGYYKREMGRFLYSAWGSRLVYLCAILSFGFFLLTWNHPLPQFPDWAKLHFIAPDDFYYIYNHYFLKNQLGILRVVNAAVLFVSVYALMTALWKPLNQLLGWFFIPLGQASLYVFFVHIFLLLLIANTRWTDANHFWVNSLIHTGLMLFVWGTVKAKFLFRWIPH